MRGIIALRRAIRKILPDRPFPVLGKMYSALFSFCCPSKIKTGPFEVFIQPGDYFSGDYEPEVTKAFREIVQSHWVVADVGANIGYHTLELSRLAREVWAFEPCKTTYALLARNLSHNDIRNVRAINKGLSDRDGFALLETSGGSGSYKIGNWGERVETLRADSLNVRFDFAKIDIEGHTLQALRGMRRILHQKPILLVEFNPAFQNEVEMLRFLERYEYQFEDAKIRRPVTVDDLASYTTHTNLLCRPAKRGEANRSRPPDGFSDIASDSKEENA